MSKTDKNLSQIISEAQINILDSNESLCEERADESSSFMKDALLAKCRDTIEVIYIKNLYLEIESQKRQRREAELTARETQTTLQNLEKRLKESNMRVIALQDENEKLSDQIEVLKKNLKVNEKNSIASKIRDELSDEISALKLQAIEKNSFIQDLQSSVKSLESKLAKLDHENTRYKEELEETQVKYEDLVFKCDRLSAQSKISETVTSNLKQAQEDYTRYIKEEKEFYENKEKDLREKFEQLESKLKKRYQSKEQQLKQEVKVSIEEIQRSLELNDAEHLKTRNENIQIKESIKALNEKSSELEKNLRDQIEKLEQELQSSSNLVREKANSLERTESMQKLEKSKLDSLIAREKDLEQAIKALEDKLRLSETRASDLKRQLDAAASEVSALKSEIIKKNNKIETKDLEIKQLARESEIDRGKLLELDTENKKLRIRNETKSKSREKQESVAEDSMMDEISNLKQKLSKATSLKSVAEQKYSAAKEDLLGLEEKIKQDSSFFRTEAMRKDEELARMKKKFETKLREIYAENSLVTEQLRTDLLRLHSEVRNRDLKDSGFWISKSLEDLMRKIPSY